MRARRVLAVLVLGALVAGGGWLVFVSNALGVRQIVIEGETSLRDRDVRARVTVPEGTPLARVDAAGVAASVRRLPQVATARVDRRWPHVLAVVVTERVPLAVVSSGPSYAVVDREGVVLHSASRAPEGYPMVLADGSAQQAALTTLDSLPPALRADVRRLSARTPENITLELAGSRRVRWGSSEGSAQKSAVLATLLRSVPRAQVYDVTAPGAPTTR